VAVFEPRSATACRRIHQDQYAKSFDPADEVVFAPLGRSNLPPEEALDLARLVRDLGELGKVAANEPSVEAIVDRLGKSVSRGDVVALLSNGAFGGIHAKLLDRLAEPA
jgi:UDP-N-acetylmuramate: L-alanyl-gamma-D-glutamyl-meso-diaminopimelate ligase